MKKLSVILNVILFILVGVLFYLHFSSVPKAPVQEPVSQSSSEEGPRLRISYVNIDSLEAHYTFFQEKIAELDKKRQSIQSELTRRQNEIQSDIQDLQKRASTLTQAQGEKVQQKILEKRQKLQSREQQLREDFVKEQQQFNQNLHTRLQRFLNRYNASKHYNFILSYSSEGSPILFGDDAHDITNEIIRGLNAESGSTAVNK